MSDLPRGNMGSDGLDPREFGCGIETNKKAIAWQKRAAFWRNKAIELGYKPVGEEQPEAIADKQMTHDQEREKFEKWIMEVPLCLDPERAGHGYADSVADAAWEAWQAAKREPDEAMAKDAELRKAVFEHVADLRRCADTARQHNLEKLAAEFELAATELETIAKCEKD